MTAPRFRQGDVWLTRLDPTEGHEIRKTRPWAIVSPDGMNAHLGTVIIVPLTSGSKPARFRVTTEFRGLNGLILGDQIRCVAKSRLLKFIAPLEGQSLRAALATLREMFEE